MTDYIVEHQKNGEWFESTREDDLNGALFVAKRDAENGSNAFGDPIDGARVAAKRTDWTTVQEFPVTR